MSVLAIADLSAGRPAATRRARVVRPRPTRLRPVPAGTRSVTVTISVSATGSPEGERVLAALRDLVVAAGTDAAVVLDVGSPQPSAGALVPAHVVHLDPRSRVATRDGRPLDLSRLEFDLLLFFARHPHQVFGRSQLLAQVWGHTHTTNRTVDVHVSRLRSKAGDPDILTTVYGVGYRLADDTRVLVGED
jgi:Transcriptional regulatory protein, C terminal